MKKILLVAAFIVIASSFLPVARPQPVDIIAGAPDPSLSVVYPAARYILEPFAGFASYVLSFRDPRPQLYSWLGWLALVSLVISVVRRRNIMAAGLSLAATALLFVTLVVGALLLPIPGPRLRAEGGRAVNFHSHTFYSHDGVSGPAASRWYHRNLGFDAFFVTDHGRSDGFGRFSDPSRRPSVLPGMQISTTEHISLLVLADRPFEAADLRDLAVKQVIDRAHERGFLVVVPHWWKWRRFTWEELAVLGIDGFEVYNTGYRSFPEDERKALIAFCRSRGLLAVGSTDWHGWGYAGDVWTVLPASAEPVFEQIKGRPPVKIVVYGRPEARTALRSFFEPFVGMYYYFGGLNLPQRAGWLGWLLAAWLVLSAGWGKRFRRLFPLAVAAVLAAAALYYFVIWLGLGSGNEILSRLVVPVLAFLSLGGYFIGRMHGKDPD